MKKIINLAKNSLRSLALGFRFAPYLTVALFFTTLVSYLAPLYQAKLLGDIINQIVLLLETLDAGSAMIGLIALYASVTAFTSILNILSTHIDKYWGLAMEQGLEIMTATKRAEIDLGHYENPDFQNQMSLGFNRGLWRLHNLAFSQITNVASILLIILSSVITSQLEIGIYIIVLISSLPLFIVELLFGNVTWSIWNENSSRQRLLGSIENTFRERVGITQTKLLQNDKHLIGKIATILAEFKRDQYKVDNRRLLYSIGASIFAAMGFGFAFYLISQKVVLGIITVGAMVFLVNILGQLVGAISTLLKDIASQYESNLFVDDFFKVIDIKPYIKVAKNPIALNLKAAPMIEFKNVWFKYDGTETWILRGLNFKIHPGEKVAIVGENSAEKTTLIKLLARIYDPSKGEILINNIDLRDIDPKEWMSYLAILLQDYIGYDFTVGESIAMGRTDKETDFNRAREAASLSGAHSFITRYEKGYHQQVGKEFEGGIELSKGQNQRLALARIIYRKGFVLILDEPTAAIDAKSEMEIFENMEKASGQATLILITHRFNTTQNVDTIHVIEHGEIVESGNHKDLLRRNGIYAEMFKAQAKSFLEEKE